MWCICLELFLIYRYWIYATSHKCIHFLITLLCVLWWNPCCLGFSRPRAIIRESLLWGHWIITLGHCFCLSIICSQFSVLQGYCKGLYLNGFHDFILICFSNLFLVLDFQFFFTFFVYIFFILCSPHNYNGCYHSRDLL